MNKGISKDSLIAVGAIVLLTIWSIGLLLFALLSGAEAAEGTVSGVVSNAPNALPWIIPIVLIYVTWKRQILGGFLFLLFGIATIFMFSTHESAGTLVVISIPSILLGSLLMTQNMWDRSVRLSDEMPLSSE
jgi:hypothetical protein